MNHWSSSSPKSSISVPFLATSNAPRTAHRAVRALRATRGTSLHQDRPKGSPRFCSLRYSEGGKVGWEGEANRVGDLFWAGSSVRIMSECHGRVKKMMKPKRNIYYILYNIVYY